MGAIAFYRAAYGESPDEAYNRACIDAQYEKGHQDGYSGDLNSKDGYVLVKVPGHVELSVWLNAIKGGNLPPTLQSHAGEFQRQQGIYQDKEEPALCFEIPAESRGDRKKYIFLGYAPY